MKTTKLGSLRTIRLLASLSLAGLIFSQLPLNALFNTPALGQAPAVYTDPGDDDGGDFLGIGGISNSDAAQVGVVGLVTYGVVAAVTAGAGEAAAAAAAAGAGAGAVSAAPAVLPAVLSQGDENKPIWDSLSDDDTHRFTQFTKAAEINDLKQEPMRDTKSGPYTVFAPTDAAFISLPRSDSAKLMDANSRLENQKTLAKHVILGKYTIKDLEKLDNGFPLATASGETVTITKNSDGSVNINGIPVGREDIKASNGVAHPISTIIP